MVTKGRGVGGGLLNHCDVHFIIKEERDLEEITPGHEYQK